MGGDSRFRFVDFAAAALPGFRNHVVPINEVPQLIAQYGADECYASIFCFSDDILLYLAERRVDGRPSVAGYDGKVWAPFLPLDIDAQSPSEVDEALEVARCTCRLLLDRWRLDAAAVHTYFSGAKGFHVLVDTRAFGRMAAARDLPRVFSRLRLEILHGLPDSARLMFDLTIGDKVRLLRLPNTRHRGSGLYKVALTNAELGATSVAAIRTLARTPRPLPRVRVAGLLPVEPVQPAPTAVELFRKARRTVRRARGPHPYRSPQPPDSAAAALCAARRVMWESHVPPGNRNNVAIRLASAFRLAGYKQDETYTLLVQWNQRRDIRLPMCELRAVAQSAYARSYAYAYGCHDEVIRSVCPFVGRLHECADYREQYLRADAPSAPTGSR